MKILVPSLSIKEPKTQLMEMKEYNSKNGKVHSEDLNYYTAATRSARELMALEQYDWPVLSYYLTSHDIPLTYGEATDGPNPGNKKNESMLP